MHRIVSVKSYRKSYKRLLKSGRKEDIKKLEKVIFLIASGKKLDAKFEDHKLHGELLELRECHIKSNLLLIYRKDKESLVLILINVGSHDEFFD